MQTISALIVGGTCALLVVAHLVACSPDDDAFPGYTNKGCLGKGSSCGSIPPPNYPPAEDAKPAYVPPAECDSMRTQSPRTNLTSDEVRALLPGHYRGCSFDVEMGIVLEQNGLVGDGDRIVVGSCGTSSCEMLWGAAIGTVQVWTDPTTVLSFSGDRTRERNYVRIGD
jgi:hypothetical protein